MDKKELYGISVTVGKYEEYIEKACANIDGYSCFLNSHMIHEFHKSEGFKKVLNNARYVIPDGVPVLYSLRLFGNNQQERIAGNDVIYSLIEAAKSKKLKIYLIGSTEIILNKISDKLNKIAVAHEVYSPPYLPIEKFDFNAQAQRINKYQPDLIFVGLGCPKQEIWMYEMRKKVKSPMFGLGGAFLLYAGVDNRAPKWMRNLGLEWLYRLSLEPKRLFRRYLITNSYFCGLFLKEIFLKKNSTK